MIFNLTCASGRTLFQELEYIQSNGTQYIETGVNFRNQTFARITSTYEFINNSEHYAPIFALNDFGISSGLFNMYRDTTYGTDLCWGFNGVTGRITNGATLNSPKYFDAQVTADGQAVITGDISGGYSHVNSMPNVGLRLFGGWINQTQSSVYYGTVRLGRTDIYLANASNKVREYIPVRRIRDGAIGFLDHLTGELIMSPQGVPFTAGPDVPGSIIVV